MELPRSGAANGRGGRRLLERRSRPIARVEEAELLARARAGDRVAFDALFRANRDRVHGLVVRMGAEPGTAEEIVLDAFTRAWIGLPSFRGESRFSTWVCSIARRALQQAYRTERRHARRFEPLEDADPDPPAGPPPIEDALGLERAIASLPAGAREALLLRHVLGFSCAEAAEVMEVSIGTVKSQASRACALLRERLSRD